MITRSTISLRDADRGIVTPGKDITLVLLCARSIGFEVGLFNVVLVCNLDQFVEYLILIRKSWQFILPHRCNVSISQRDEQREEHQNHDYSKHKWKYTSTFWINLSLTPGVQDSFLRPFIREHPHLNTKPIAQTFDRMPTTEPFFFISSLSFLNFVKFFITRKILVVQILFLFTWSMAINRIVIVFKLRFLFHRHIQ